MLVNKIQDIDDCIPRKYKPIPQELPDNIPLSHPARLELILATTNHLAPRRLLLEEHLVERLPEALASQGVSDEVRAAEARADLVVVFLRPGPLGASLRLRPVPLRGGGRSVGGGIGLSASRWPRCRRGLSRLFGTRLL